MQGLREVSMLQACRSADEFERLNHISEGTYGVVYRSVSCSSLLLVPGSLQHVATCDRGLIWFPVGLLLSKWPSQYSTA